MTPGLPKPLADALASLADRAIFPTAASSAEMRAFGADFHRANFASARTTDAGYLQRLHDMVTRLVNPRAAGGEPGTSLSIPDFVAEGRRYLAGIGYAAEPGKEDTIEDLASDARLRLVAETNAAVHRGFGAATFSNRPAVLDAFPALELYRLRFVERERDWDARWRAAVGEAGDDAARTVQAKTGRMVARKDSGVWQALGDGAGGYMDTLGNPFPPFAFKSGMRTRSVSRAEAIRLGVIEDGDQVEPRKLTLSGDLADRIPTGLAKELADVLGDILGDA